MPDILIRDIPDEVASALSAKAAEDGMERSPWLRAQLLKLAAQPTVRKQYGFKAFGDNGARITLRRFPEGHVQRGANGCDQAQFNAYQKAALCMERNDVGDYEKAYTLLSERFEEVFPGNG